MSFHWRPPASSSPATVEESWALTTMLEEEAKMTPCPPNLLPIYKVQVVDGSTRHTSIVEKEDFDVVTDFLETLMREEHPELGPGLDAVHKEQRKQPQQLYRSKVTQGLSDHPSKVKGHQQHLGKRKKTYVGGKQEPTERKKAKFSTKKASRPLMPSDNDFSAEAALERYETSTQSQGCDEILSKYKFLTVTKSTSPSKLDNTLPGPLQRKGVLKAGSKAKGVSKKGKASKKNISGDGLEKGEDGLMEKTDETVSSRNQVDQVEALAMREQMESATSHGNHMEGESKKTVDHHIRKFFDEEGSTVNTANILNKYKFLTDVAELPREDGVEEVTMEETTREDLLGKAEDQWIAGSDLVEEMVEEGKEQVSKVSKKSSSAAAKRKENMKERVQCEHCEKDFATPTGLKQHITVHTNEKPYQCKDCPDKFRNLNMLSGHRKKTHPKSLQDKIGMVPSTLV